MLPVSQKRNILNMVFFVMLFSVLGYFLRESTLSSLSMISTEHAKSFEQVREELRRFSNEFEKELQEGTGRKPSCDTKFNFPPGVDKLEIDIGTHCSPFVPKGNDWAVLGFEPNLPYLDCIKDFEYDNLFVVPAAVSNQIGMTEFHVTNNGKSSSMGKPNQDDVNQGEKLHIAKTLFVPTVTLKSILDSIPNHISIEFVKVDAQGYDFSIIKSAGNSLRKAKKYQVEVQTSEAGYELYGTSENKKEFHIEYFTKNGFLFDRGLCDEASNWDVSCGVDENLIFIRDDVFAKESK